MHCLFWSGHPEHAYLVFADMAEKGVAPCATTYNTLLDGQFKAGHATNAYRMFRYLQRAGLPVGIVTYNTMINGLCKSGKVGYARMVLKELGRTEHAPNAVTWSVRRSRCAASHGSRPRSRGGPSGVGGSRVRGRRRCCSRVLLGEIQFSGFSPGPAGSSRLFFFRHIISRVGGVVAQVIVVRLDAAELGQRGARLGRPQRLRWRRPKPGLALVAAELGALPCEAATGAMPRLGASGGEQRSDTD
jgi:pentatricopeptide repeat protein